MRIITVATVVVLGVLAGCGRGGGPGGGSDGPSGDLPEGRTFLSTAVVGRDLVPGSRITIGFKDGKLTASAGCNHLFGSAQLDSGRLVVSELGGTEMACEPKLATQEEWFREFLQAGPRWQLTGDELTLTTSESKIRLMDRRVAEPDKPLVGPRWVLDSLLQGAAASSVPSGVRAWITFGKDGLATGNAGCNQFGGGPEGNYSVSGDTLRFHDIAVTRMACGGDKDDVEREVLQVLSGTVSHQIAGSALTITHPSGKGLRFRAA
jgi:heat shock protein HslJ